MTQPGKPFPRIDGQLRCGPFPVKELARRFGTPLYLYDFDFTRGQVEAFQEAFASARLLLAYSVKANGNLAILNRLGSMGVGADIVSGGELYRALKAGIQPGKILFAGVGKTDD